MLFLYELIEKSLLLRDFPSATPLSNPDTMIKMFPSTNALLETSTKRWNQANLNYFNSHLDKAYGEGKIISVKKNIYYKNVILFVQHFQSFITF